MVETANSVTQSPDEAQAFCNAAQPERWKAVDPPVGSPPGWVTLCVVQPTNTLTLGITYRTDRIPATESQNASLAEGLCRGWQQAGVYVFWTTKLLPLP